MPIRLKRGTTVPSPSNLVTGEVAINTTNGFAYTKTDAGNVIQIGANVDLSAYAPLNSPALTGVPTAPTATVGTATSQIATTNFVQTAISGLTVTSAQTLITEVRNTTGATLTKGTVVYVSGAGANKPLAIKAQANLEATSAFTLGLVQSDILNNQNGFVVTSGAITGLDTQAYTEGTFLYLSPTVAGGYTSTKPSAPDQLVFIGIVITSSNSQGAIEVSIQNGYELEELHDVLLGTKVDKDLLAYESASGLFKNKTASSLGIAELSGASFSGKVSTTATSTTAGMNIGTSVVSPTTTVAGDIWVGTNNLFFKDANNVQRAVLNNNTVNTFSTNQIISASTTAPLLRITQTGAGQAILVEDASNPDTTAFVVNGDGILGLGVNASAWTPTVGTLLEVAGRGLFSSTTTYPALNLGVVASTPTTLANGDIWIDNVLRYRVNGGTVVTAGLAIAQTFTQPQVISTATSATLPALRITNQSTSASSLVVEDAANPDTTSFVIDVDGNVGIGVANGSSITSKLVVNGAITCLTQNAGTANTSVATTEFVRTGILPEIKNFDDFAVFYSPSTITRWNTIIRIYASSEQSVQLPTNLQSNLPIGSQVVFLQLGSGRLDFLPTNGNSVMSAGGKYKTIQQYSVMTAIKTATNEWLIAGDLSVS